MSVQTTCAASPSSTPSPASACGVTPPGSPDGLTIDPCGQAHRLASLSATQAKSLGLLTSGTYGPPSSISSISAALTCSLESRLRARTRSLGSTMYRLTWKERATPSGRSICALRASAPRTSDSGSSSSERAPWLTPSARDWKDTAGMSIEAVNPDGSTRTRIDQLPRIALLAGYPSPTTPSGGQTYPEGTSTTGQTPDGRKVQVTLELVAQATGWPSPGASDGVGGKGPRAGVSMTGRLPDGRKATMDLSASVKLAMDHLGPTNGLWGDVDWLLCRDGKWRPVEPGTFPLAHGAPARVGRLRGYGNAIVAPAAAHFIASYLEAEAAGFDLVAPSPGGGLIDGDLAELLG